MAYRAAGCDGDSIIIGSGAAPTSTGNESILIGTQTAAPNFGGCIVIGSKATATANNQLVLGSSLVPLSTAGGAGAVSTYLNVLINGTNYKLALLSP